MSEDEGCEFSDEIKKTTDFCGLTSDNIRDIESHYLCGSNRLLKYMDRYEMHPEAEIGLLFQSNYDGESRVSRHRLNLLSEEADEIFREAKEMTQDHQPDLVKVNLWSTRIVKIHLDCFPILNTLFVHGDDCRLEIDDFSRRYHMDLLPYSVLKAFRTNMSCVRDGVLCYRNVAFVLRQIIAFSNNF